MRHVLSRVSLAYAVLTLLSGAHTAAHAQGLTGQISGTVMDSGQGVLPGATVIVRNAATSNTRETMTGPDGTFVFPDLLAGTYDIKVTLGGFKTFEQKAIALGATDRITQRTITLEVGELQEQVTVTGEAVAVQTPRARG